MSMEETEKPFESYGMPINEYSLLAVLSGGSLAWLGDFDAAMTWLRKGLDAAVQAQNIFSAGLAETWLSIVLVTRGLGEEAIEHISKASQSFEEVRAPASHTGAIWYIQGYAKFIIGDLDEARQCMDKALALLRDSEMVWYVAYIYGALAMVHCDAGDLPSARSCVASALEWSQKLNQKHWKGFAKIVAGKILGKSDLLQTASAEASILEGIDILKQLE